MGKTVLDITKLGKWEITPNYTILYRNRKRLTLNSSGNVIGNWWIERLEDRHMQKKPVTGYSHRSLLYDH
jgi:hypothetical protein